MQRAPALTILLVGLCLVGSTTEFFPFQDKTGSGRMAWSLFLIGAPLFLVGLVWTGWSWAAMACVMYGTVGLALDVATVASILGGKDGAEGLLPLSALSGLLNLSLIVAGGQAFVQSLQRPLPPESRPPSPHSPSSSSAP